MATLAVAMFFLGGVVLVILGVIGEYLGRIYIEVKKRPFYLVEEEIVHQHVQEQKGLN
jgi:dolichol-phosphate mannosyltransferase